MSTEEKKISIIPFSGLREDWEGWSFKFLTKAKVKGYYYLLKEDNDVIIPEEGEVFDESTEEGKKKAKIEKDNSMAFSDLTLSINIGTKIGLSTLMLVKRTKGNIRVAWKLLKGRYESSTCANQGNLQDQFYAARCKTYQSPELFINELDILRSKLIEAGGDPISDNIFIGQVLNHLPPQYYTNVLLLRKQMDKGEGLSVQEMIMELEECYQANKLSRKNAAWEETALVSFGQGYKGKCNFCGKQGHKKSQCKLFQKAE